MQSIVIASHNKGKLAEFRRMLTPLGIEVLSLSDAGFEGEIAEGGDSFSQNAEIKARAVFDATGLATIADDSGLCIDFLGGRPGIYSARYLGEDSDYPTKWQGVFDEMKDCPENERTARFVAALAFIDTQGHCHSFIGTCEGVIGHAPAGSGGFGYDPIFYVEGGSFSQLSDSEKDKISHRGKALRAFVAALPEIISKQSGT